MTERAAGWLLIRPICDQVCSLALCPHVNKQVQAGALLIQDRVHGIFKVSPPLGSYAVVGRDVDGVGG